MPDTDSWARTVGAIDILGGLGGEVNDWIGLLSMYGSPDTPFADCRERAINPQTQTDLGNTVPIGTRFYRCIPPDVS